MFLVREVQFNVAGTSDACDNSLWFFASPVTLPSFWQLRQVSSKKSLRHNANAITLSCTLLTLEL